MLSKQQRVLVIDDHPLVNDAFSRAVTAMYPDFETVEALDATTARRLLKDNEANWAMILCDLNLPDDDGLNLVREVRATIDTHIPILILTGQNDPVTVQASRCSGADGFVQKTASSDIFRKAFQAVLAGSQYFPDSVPINDLPVPDQLSKRQLQILDLILQGRPNKAIAEELNLSEGTVKNLVSHLFDTFSITTRSRSALISTVSKLGYKKLLPH